MSRNFRRAAWREARGGGRSFVRGMGRNIVYLAGMAICFAIYAAIEPLVSQWQFPRDGLGWFLLIGMALASALIFFILELCGVYLSGRPLFVRKRTGSSNRWGYRKSLRGPSRSRELFLTGIITGAAATAWTRPRLASAAASATSSSQLSAEDNCWPRGRIIIGHAGL